MKTDLRTIEAVQEWLEPMDYLELWYAIAPYDLPLCGQSRTHCDVSIREGRVSEDTILYCLKEMARMDLTERYDLPHRDPFKCLTVVK